MPENQHGPLPQRAKPKLRPVDKCLSCGKFVGRYPNGFCCDTHCWRCVCTQCPGFRQPLRVGVGHA